MNKKQRKENAIKKFKRKKLITIAVATIIFIAIISLIFYSVKNASDSSSPYNTHTHTLYCNH